MPNFILNKFVALLFKISKFIAIGIDKCRIDM